MLIKVEKILKGILDSILSLSSLVKIQIMDWKVCLRHKGKTFLGIVNKLLKTKRLLTSPSNVLPITSSKLFRQQFRFSLKVKVMESNPSYLLKSFVLQKRPIKLPSDEIRSKLIFVHSTAFAPIFTISCWFPHTSLSTKRFEDCAIFHMKIVSS